MSWLLAGATGDVLLATSDGALAGRDAADGVAKTTYF